MNPKSTSMFQCLLAILKYELISMQCVGEKGLGSWVNSHGLVQQDWEDYND